MKRLLLKVYGITMLLLTIALIISLYYAPTIVWDAPKIVLVVMLLSMGFCVSVGMLYYAFRKEKKTVLQHYFSSLNN